ncbi:nucleotidyltransferase domain-containing protein [Neobacillus sp. NPDC093182]|uniref:nucleotidyltransferase domain-containing protein n=1 Tax=Neobacillus sp. NPDC093182 TaxID=3364297 RepID=UPI00382CA32B
MLEHILKVLKQIEKEYDVKILYACESGSRAWGFPSIDSDYDVRFIYVHKKEWYLSIDQKRDVLEVPKHDKLSIQVDKLLDLNGWELAKALRLFRKSNPPLLEWLHSNIIYYQGSSAINKMKELESQIFSPTSGIYHYLKMAKGNYRDYLNREEVKIKRYFNIFRPLLAARWIEMHHAFPPIKFTQLVEDNLPTREIKLVLDDIIMLKKAGEVLDPNPRTELINHFVEAEIDHLEKYAREVSVNKSDPTELLNQLFRETLEEVWG